MRRPSRLRWIRLMASIVGVLLAILVVPSPALAHGDMSEEPPETQVAEPGPAAGAGTARPLPTELRVVTPEGATLGRSVQVRAVLTDRKGRPISGMTVVFEADAFWGEELQGHMVIGTAVTDEQGVASLTTDLRTSGSYEIAASFPGNGRYRPAMEETHLEVSGDQQLYSPSVGLRIPGLNMWVLVAVIALVWGTFLLVGRRIVRIAREPDADPGSIGDVPDPTRRRFLARLVPVGAQVGVAALGAGLVGLVIRSPRTHGNLMAAPAEAYHRTPVARLGQMAEMREMPEPLARSVSFSRDVLPIFRAHGGPHVVAPEHSPPPGGLRLDSYEAVMAKEGVIVPGEPEESELVEHLLSIGMQMPPAVPPLPDDQIQLIVTWIAQGAKDD